MTKKEGFGLLFAALFTIFLGGFFDLISIHRIISGLLLFIGIMFRSVTNAPRNLRSRHKKRIILVLLCFTAIIGFTKNVFTALSFIILIAGILYAFWDLDYYKNKVVRFNMFSYCLLGAYSLIYFVGFAVASHIIGDNDTLKLECKDIYSYYSSVSGIFYKNSSGTQLATYPPTFQQKIGLQVKQLLKDAPGLSTIYAKIRIYQQDIASSITDQQQINREICDLVSVRIHEIYDQSNIKIGLVILIGLFLYPFFIVLLYGYGLMVYILFRVALHYKIFSITQRQVIKTSLE